MKTYIIREVATGKMVNCFEGVNGKARAEELVGIHNKYQPQDQWHVMAEIV
jgi:hypothetical protein